MGDVKSSFVQAGPVQLQYFERGSGAQDVVLVHGYQSSARIWRLVQESLHESRYRSVAISHRGAGDSDRSDSIDDYSVESFARDQLSGLTELGRKRFVLVGHSMGGATVTQFALEHPELVQALVLLNPASLHGRGLSDGWEEQVRQQFAPDRRREEPGSNAGETPDDFRAALAADVARNPIERMLGGRKSMATLRLRERLPELSMPVMVVGGDRDTTVGVHNILAEYLALKPEVRSLQIFHGVGHSPNVECAGDLAAVLERFISTAVEG
jgi:pimeloyl-ACP methyl ester carboxylesterase